jgi:hypothetical protein
MTCQECELLLAAGGGAPDHLAACAACRALREDLRANAEALVAMRDEALVTPQVRHARAGWAWAAAAAAAIVLALALSRTEYRPPVPVEPVMRRAPSPAPGPPARPERDPLRGPASPPHRTALKEESAPLLVKILTDDPDVVVYWLIDAKEGP